MKCQWLQPHMIHRAHGVYESNGKKFKQRAKHTKERHEKQQQTLNPNKNEEKIETQNKQQKHREVKKEHTKTKHQSIVCTFCSLQFVGFVW